MIRLPKSVLSFGAIAAVVGVFALAVPRAAHAVAAALVTVNNNAANPAITESTASQAAQLVNLSNLGYVSQSGPSYFYAPQATTSYSVPGNQSLVITDIDINTAGCGAGPQNFGVGIDISGVNYGRNFLVPTNATTHFSYHSGIVFAPGSVPTLVGTCQSAQLEVNGYLTAN
jgi:hypothetical protein